MPGRLRWFVGSCLMFGLIGFQAIGHFAGEFAGGEAETLWKDENWRTPRVFVLVLCTVAPLLSYGVFHAQAWLRPMILIIGLTLFAISEQDVIFSWIQFGIYVAWPSYVFYFDPNVKAWFQRQKHAVAPANS
jgi:hypothetical protein